MHQGTTHEKIFLCTLFVTASHDKYLTRVDFIHLLENVDVTWRDVRPFIDHSAAFFQP